MTSVHPQQLPLIPSRLCNKCGVSRPSDDFRGNRTCCKACERAYAREYARKYRAEHPEETRESVKIWQRNFPEKNHASNAAWRAAHQQEIRENNKAWRTDHAEECRAAMIEWQTAHPEAVKANSANRQARKFNRPGTITAENIQRLQTAQKGLCAYCQQPYGLYHIEHKIPISRGGSNWPENVCLSCPTCNLRKGRKTDTEYREIIEDK